MLINDYHIVLRFREGEVDLEEYDLDHYMYITRGTVIGSDESDRTVEVGRFRLTFVDVGAAENAGISAFDIFDYTRETYDYYCAIFNTETSGPSAALYRLFEGQVWPGNVLVLDRLEILPEFRGHGLGLVVMRRLIERFGAGAAIVAITPFPLQHACAWDDDDEDEDEAKEDEWRQKMKFDDLDKNLRRATAKLRRHYAKLGFRSMKGTPFMFRDAETELPDPQRLAGD